VVFAKEETHNGRLCWRSRRQRKDPVSVESVESVVAINEDSSGSKESFNCFVGRFATVEDSLN
jgi:hypothetical protein